MDADVGTKALAVYSKECQNKMENGDDLQVKIVSREASLGPNISDADDDEQTDKILPGDESATPHFISKKKHYRLSLVAFWIFGVCNSFAFVAMLSAAHDILHEDGYEDRNQTLVAGNCTNGSFKDQEDAVESDVLYCNPVSTGAILLADIVPTLLVTSAFPLFLQQIHYHIKLAIVVWLAIVSFIVVAFAHTVWLSVLGVVCAATSAGLGEITFLSLSTYYHKDVISSWSSGTGGSGVFGALVYAGFTSLGLSPSTSLLIMLVIPVLLLISYVFVLPSAAWNKRKSKSLQDENNADVEDNDDVTNGVKKLTVKQKVELIPYLMKFMVPLAVVYFAEYFINQGLHEFLYFNGEFLSASEQYRWYQVDYQIGVFISRSSVNFIHIRQLWILPTLQVINLAVLLFQLYYRFIPSFWIIIVIVLWEGLLGGGAYVNTFYRMTNDLSADIKEYCIGMTTFGDSVGIAAAGAAAIPFHNYVCGLRLKV